MKCAIFDFDGTLAKREKPLGFLFAERLTEGGMFRPARMSAMWRHLKEHRHDHVRLVEALRQDWAEGIKRQEEAEVRKEADAFSEPYVVDGLHPGTPELLRFFTDSGYFTAVISASPIESLDAVLAGFRIDAIVGTTVETEAGVYTGELDDGLDGNGKGRIVRRLFEENCLDPRQSFSFGDTEHDIPLLDFPGITGIALHPNGVLRKMAGEKGWPVHDDAWGLLGELEHNITEGTELSGVPVVSAS